LARGGNILVAVPDFGHPSVFYRNWVKPGGWGPGSEDHKEVYDHSMLVRLIHEAGFPLVWRLEWWEDGDFHRTEYDEKRYGKITRSSRHDHRNTWEMPLAYTSLIVIGVK
jgi:predicted SAM-dependent methyltransferase